MFQSVIDPATVQAYRETHYCVRGPSPFVLRIGEFSPDLLVAQERHKSECSAFITACNPYSQVLDGPGNSLRQAELVQELAFRGIAFLEGIGQHPSNAWASEESFLVFGISLEAAKALGRRFEQNAIVWSAADAVPQLILLR
ncbi:MAG: DUF3293 domain-containing protein [Ramlibacter sp.]|nr:DUF3293 domain-containing protein [Ramlibacter sp.]MDH4376595.1 DUF3293 domain-containing protein [Ramlibacter sp.]